MTDVRNLVQAKRFEMACGDIKLIVDRKSEFLYIPPSGYCTAGYRGAMVQMMLGSKILEMTTPVAVKLGIALCTNGGACQYLGDVVSLNIAGDELTLLPEIAAKLGAVILRKADRADDFQRGIPS